METAMNLDMVFEASEEAKVCLTCTRKKCLPECRKIKREVKRLSGKETKMDRVHRLVEEEYEAAKLKTWVRNPFVYALLSVADKLVEEEKEARRAKANEKG